MSSRLEDLRDLAEMLDQGKITQREFEVVKTELLEASAEEWITSVASSNGKPSPDGPPEEPKEETPDPKWLVLIRRIPTVYRAALGAAVVVFVIGAFLAGQGTADGSPALSESSSDGAEIPEEPPAGSLGIPFQGLSEGWNAMDDPPFIAGGITTTPESGPLDSFLYKFDNSGLVAGAYNPSDGYVYALMVRAGLHHPSISNMYTHLCYLLHPGSQACLDTFIEETGMFGRAPAELIDIEHFATWEFEGHEWRLEIRGNVETIRVLGDQSLD